MKEKEINVKFLKMGLDIDNTVGLNHRLRTIIETANKQYLFIEILQGNRSNRHYTGLSKKDYFKKYPYEHYIIVDFCFRVDLPEDFYNNHSDDFAQYEKIYFNLDYTKESIIELLQKFNKDITNYTLLNYDNFKMDKDKYFDDMKFYGFDN